MKKMIFLAVLAGLGVGVYGVVRVAKHHPDSTFGHAVTTATEVGVRSNPFLSEPEENASDFPTTDELTGIDDPTNIEDLLADPLPAGDPVPVDGGTSPTSFTDPIVIPEPTTTVEQKIQGNDPVILSPIDGNPATTDPTEVFPSETGSNQPVMPYTVNDGPEELPRQQNIAPQKAIPEVKMPFADEETDDGAMLNRTAGIQLVLRSERGLESGVKRVSRPEPARDAVSLEEIHNAVRGWIRGMPNPLQNGRRRPEKLDTMEFRPSDYQHARNWPNWF